MAGPSPATIIYFSIALCCAYWYLALKISFRAKLLFGLICNLGRLLSHPRSYYRYFGHPNTGSWHTPQPCSSFPHAQRGWDFLSFHLAKCCRTWGGRTHRRRLSHHFHLLRPYAVCFPGRRHPHLGRRLSVGRRGGRVPYHSYYADVCFASTALASAMRQIWLATRRVCCGHYSKIMTAGGLVLRRRGARRQGRYNPPSSCISDCLFVHCVRNSGRWWWSAVGLALTWYWQTTASTWRASSANKYSTNFPAQPLWFRKASELLWWLASADLDAWSYHWRRQTPHHGRSPSYFHFCHLPIVENLWIFSLSKRIPKFYECLLHGFEQLQGVVEHRRRHLQRCLVDTGWLRSLMACCSRRSHFSYSSRYPFDPQLWFLHHVTYTYPHASYPPYHRQPCFEFLLFWSLRGRQCQR